MTMNQCCPIRDALRSELSWTHYRLIMRVENPQARAYYLNRIVFALNQADQGGQL